LPCSLSYNLKAELKTEISKTCEDTLNSIIDSVEEELIYDLNNAFLNIIIFKQQELNNTSFLNNSYSYFPLNENELIVFNNFIQVTKEKLKLVFNKSLNQSDQFWYIIYPKRKDVLNNAIEEIKEYNITKKSLKRLCSTRWIERYHAVNDFLKLFECIIKSLDLISNCADSDTFTQASNLRSSILQGEFIICLHIVAKGFGIGLLLSKQLQRINIYLY